ncbi:M23 family metallopeptidase [Salibacterium halotolerans]|uniref:Stage IV sporulation protein FA n=1 Tax=Salibacterium halotolerans TaxID=1884432 RepID=A0A1I5SUM3_9BACI|nr:M23 family metallopeptidase [Salibacterium halotolerans]SFP74465.1 stage IV sporulation protein FA [Salibacterium halotolerans]
MDRNIQKVRRQVHHKRRKRAAANDRSPSYGYYPSHSDAPYHEPEFYVWQDQEKRQEPRRKQKGVWVLQSFLAAMVFLLTGILFQSAHPSFQGAKQFVESSFQEEFPFAAVTAWYEERFGSPVAFLPDGAETDTASSDFTAEEGAEPAAVPVSGTVAESFSENGKGVVLETGSGSDIEAVNGGLVIHTGPHEDWELAVGIQHYDGGESWYGLLDQVDVKLYDHVASGDVLGKVEAGEGNGRYALAVKKDGQYVDPMDVIAVD